MKHGVDDSLIYLTADILIEKYPNTVNARWHKAKSVDVIEKTQNDWPDSEIYEIWTQKHRPITVSSPHLAIENNIHKHCHRICKVSVLI